MSSVDEVLFAPIDDISDIEDWRQQCRDLVQRLEEIRAERNKRPPGAMLVEDLLERFYNHDQIVFWIVDPVDGKCSFEFNGTVWLSPNGYCAINDIDGEPVVEWNLFPNAENSICYTFWDEDAATAYERTL